ncbi:hypothetical protein [Legionella sp. km772]|uniref:hypothetical protein n=1 Tax=Legionella sp. km772 TaxID=2498111 RepID=UPI000F8E437F|nr:hypothetical protein [Legionella sp. km772]RUR06755.1 hypothetical protein ELY15_12900 [Legionella sp. km772]
MKSYLSTSILSTLLLGFSTAYAAPNLVLKLNKINFQIDRAEIFAANCAVESKDTPSANFNCSQASDILKKLNQKLDKVAGLNLNNDDQITQNIKQLRNKIDLVHQELTNATLATDNTNNASLLMDPSESN